MQVQDTGSESENLTDLKNDKQVKKIHLKAYELHFGLWIFLFLNLPFMLGYFTNLKPQ